MKKIKIILLAIIFTIALILLGTTNVNAETYTEIVDKNDWSEEIKCIFTIQSDNLQSDLNMNAGAMEYFVYTKDNYAINADYLYIYEFRNQMGDLITLDGQTATILIYMPNLTEGTKYDVYYFDNANSYDEAKVDETLNGDVAEVVKVDGKLYIKLETKTSKPFALNRRVSNAYKTKLESITKDGVYILDAANPKGYDNFLNNTYTDVIAGMNKGYTIYTVDDEYVNIEFDSIPGESHLVKYKYKYDTINPKIKSLIKEIENGLKSDNNPNSGKEFVIEDLNWINYLSNVKLKNDEADIGDIIYYSRELRDTLKGTNLMPYFFYREGDGSDFDVRASGSVTASYKGTLYPLNIDAGYQLKQVIYVPDDTANTDEAMMKAAKARIAKYLEIDASKVNLTIGGTRASINPDNVWAEQRVKYDLKNISSNYYILKLNGHEVKLVIERNSKKVKELEFTSKDVLTDVVISSNSGVIPLDTQINVTEIEKNTTTYKETISKLDKEKGLIYDLKLFSTSLNKNITKLADGSFEVKIPLTSDYEGKTLSAYYINNSGKVEEYEVTVNGNCAIFKTNHFSVYTIAERSVTENNKEPEKPGKTEEKDETVKTGTIDIAKYVLGITLISGVGIVIIKKKYVA